MSILLVEDDRTLASLLQSFLQSHKYIVKCVGDGAEAYALLTNSAPTRFSLILLDIGLPSIDGITLLRACREEGNILPAIIISNNVTEENEIRAFKIGANLVHRKPIHTRLLLEQIKSIMPVSSHLYAVGSGVYNSETGELTNSGKIITLTPIETTLLTYLLQLPEKVHPKEELIEYLFPEEYMSPNYIEALICRIRKKFCKIGIIEKVIVTIPYKGYTVRSRHTNH